MNKIVETMRDLKRTIPSQEGHRILVADFYPTYYQCTRRHVQGICEMITNKPGIVDVKVTEEAIHPGLGGFRVAFTVDMTEKPKQLIRQLQARVDAELANSKNKPRSLNDEMRELHDAEIKRRAFWGVSE
jgi:hypothetical protein